MQSISQRGEREKARRLSMPVLGVGKFWWAGKEMTLNIVRIGKRDITLVSPDGTFVILNNRYVEVL